MKSKSVIVGEERAFVLILDQGEEASTWSGRQASSAAWTAASLSK